MTEEFVQPKEPGDEDCRPRDFPCIGWLTLQSPIAARRLEQEVLAL